VLLEKPGRTWQEAPRRWHGPSVLRPVEVEDADGRHAVEVLRFLVGRSSQLAQQAATTYTVAQAKEAERVAEHIQRMQARGFACVADAEAAIIDYKGRGQGRRGRTGHGQRSLANGGGPALLLRGGPRDGTQWEVHVDPMARLLSEVSTAVVPCVGRRVDPPFLLGASLLHVTTRPG